MIFRREPLVEIIEYIRAQRGRGPVSIRVLDPDRGRGKYAGELVDDHVHRPFRVWVDLADRLDMRLRTPRVDGEYIELVFEPLARARTDARMTKLEDPCFVIDFLEALDRVKLAAPRVLCLGVSAGDEIALIERRYPDAAITGVDRDGAALAIARTRWPDATFIEADLAQPLAVGTFDLVVAIATLQSTDLDDRDLLRRIVQDHLAPRGAVIFAVPNCRYQDGEQRFGARMKNFSQPELGLLVKDVAFYRKYLQQHHRQVWITGKSYILVTGGIHDS